MIEARFLDYDFDEEQKAFGPPPRRPRAVPVQERVALAVIAFGLGSFVLQVAGGIGLGTWWGIVSSYGSMSAGAIWFFWVRYAPAVAGIKNDDNTFRNIQARGWIGWTLGALITTFYVVLYFYGDLQAKGMPPVLERPVRMLDPLAIALSGGEASQWFLYGVLYTLAVIVFGVRMLLKYRGNKYQQLRTASVMFFQLGLAFMLPNVLKAFHQPEYYFTYFWPLKPEYLFPGSIESLTSSGGALGVFMVFWGAAASFVAVPVLTYFVGKRWYCSWVCGCGGLAETLGDPWRQLSDKSTRAWRVERYLIHAVLVFIVVTTLLLWIDWLTSGKVFGSLSSIAYKWYGFYIGMIFSGVIGVGFYPLLGSRVWCRFGCPLAAILGIFQRVFSRFRITTNGDQCMSCGNCSTYCEMGIDVRAYAEKGENIVRASCVGCGVCAAVCPRGVLKLENGTSHKERFDGADSPWNALLAAVREGATVPERESMFPSKVEETAR